MKIILTGSTGTVGSAVLQRCIDDTSVTSIIALTRRPLDVTSPKLQNIIHKDFLKYDHDVIDHFKGAQACIWALGSPTSGKEVHIDYTMAAVNVFLTSVVPELKEGQKFRFVYTSGGLVPYLESNALFFLGAARKLRADLDRELLALAEQNPSWETFVVRPWFVTDQEPLISYLSSNSFIFRKELGAAMVDAALNGNEGRLIDNAELRTKGQTVLSRP